MQAGHLRQVSADTVSRTALNNPAGQLTHASRLPSEKVPAGHVRQPKEIAPRARLNVPAGQLMQEASDVEPGWSLTVPTGHLVQDVEPATENVPLGHTVQTDSLLAPGSDPKVPAGQRMHESALF